MCDRKMDSKTIESIDEIEFIIFCVEKGGGIQYEFSNKISELLEQGILRKVEH